jgi:pimeloyl-ACP methyl ester carboxylesterase
MRAPRGATIGSPMADGGARGVVVAGDGTRLSVERVPAAPRPGARPVVLVHGAPESSYCWRRVVAKLHAAAPGRFVTHALDLRGYGESDLAASGDYTLPTLVADLAAVVRAAHDEATRVDGSQRVHRPIVVAHDWGGAISWTFAEHHGDLLRHLVATNGPHPAAFARELVHARQAIRSWYIAFFQLPGLPRLFESRGGAFGAAFLLKMITSSSPKGMLDEADLEVYRRNLMRPGRAAAVLEYYRDIPRGGVAARRREAMEVGRVEVPATIVWGDADLALARTHPDAVRRYAARLEVRRLAGASHWVPEERPEEIVRAILDADASS